MKKQSFIQGAVILAAASLLCKMMSAMLKIPLDRFFLHEEGIAIYQSAYSIYNVFLAICVTGIPIALSSLVAKSDDEEAASLCRSTFAFVTIFASVSAVILIAFSKPIAVLLSGGGESVAQPSLIALALSLPVMGLVSSRRGFFQGKRDMRPSAISQLAESFIKVALGITLCAVGIKKGIEWGACGAICAVTLGMFCAALVLEVFYRKNNVAGGVISAKKAAEVIRLSVPMTLGAFGFTAVLLTDALSVPKILALCGENPRERLAMFGYLTRANTVYNLPATIITAFTASVVPSIAAAKAEENLCALSDNSQRAIKLIFLVAFPCMLGMVLFSEEILRLLYSSAQHSTLLMLAGVLVLVMPYVQTTTAMLQTIGKVWTPIAVTMAAVLLKVVLNFVFIRYFSVEGAMISTITAFSAVFVVNSFLLKQRVNFEGVFKTLFKLFLCAAVACGIAKVIYSLNESLLMLAAAILLAAVIYFAGVIVTGCIKKEEFSRNN